MRSAVQRWPTIFCAADLCVLVFSAHRKCYDPMNQKCVSRCATPPQLENRPGPCEMRPAPTSGFSSRPAESGQGSQVAVVQLVEPTHQAFHRARPRTFAHGIKGSVVVVVLRLCLLNMSKQIKSSEFLLLNDSVPWFCAHFMCTSTKHDF